MGPLSSVHVAVSSLSGRPAAAAGMLPLGPRLGDPLHDPYGGLDAETRPQGTVFGGAEPVSKPVKSI